MSPKLSADIRERLRKAIRSHPKVKDHVARLSDIGTMKKDDLINLGTKLGIDVDKITNEALSDDKRPSGGFPEPNWDHSYDNPGFTGFVEFDVTFALLGKSVSRRMRATYTHTPDWEYFDLKTKKFYVGRYGGTLSFQVQALIEDHEQLEQTAKGVRRRRTALVPTWIKDETLIAEGVLTHEMNDAIDLAIDAQCQAEDRQRRLEHGLEAPEKYPPLPLRANNFAEPKAD